MLPVIDPNSPKSRTECGERTDVRWSVAVMAWTSTETLPITGTPVLTIPPMFSLHLL